MFFFDPVYFLFALPPLLVALWAQSLVKETYTKYSQYRNRHRITGGVAARILLSASGLDDVKIEVVAGELSDHYDPRSRTLRLSEKVYKLPSVAALGIVAHEVGHAIQHATGYTPLVLRSAMVPVTSVGSNYGPMLFILGVILGVTGMAWLGIGLFSSALLFALITLPVEFDASRRAMRILQRTGLVGIKDAQGAQMVLTAASMTYVAAVLQALGTLLYYIWVMTGRRRN
jgi:Zn-dependent membrane protease YugP